MAAEDEAIPYPFDEPQGLTIHENYAKLQAAEGMCPVKPPYGTTTYLAVKHADVRTVLSDPRFSRAKSVGEDEPRVHPFVPRSDALVAMDPPEHTRLRKALTGAFTYRRMDALAPRVQEVVDDLLDDLEAAGPPVDLIDKFAQPMSIRVMCGLLGVPFEDRDKFSGWATASLSTASSGRTIEEINTARNEMFGYLATLATRRAEQPEADLLSVLAHARDENGTLTQTEMLGLASSVLVAGHETTANQIGSFVYVLLSDRRLWNELLESPESVQRAVEELLRVAPVMATAGFSRMATEDVDVNGHLVRQGERVMPTLFAANADPTVFPDPLAVNFHRQNIGQHVAFSYGAHHCPGNQLARMELQVALRSLLRRFPTLDLAGTPAEVPWRKTVLSRGPERLLVTW